MSEPRFNVLFICTGNSARSILAEAIMNDLGMSRGFRAYSAGSRPKGHIHPRTQSILRSYGYSNDGYRSKGWEEFASAEAPVMNFVFTVCDQAAGEACPVWPGQPMTAHWGVPDPTLATGTNEQIDKAFNNAFLVLRRRIELMLALPLDSLDQLALQRKIDEIGRA